MCYDPVSNRITLTKKRATEENTRAYLPKALPVMEEAKLAIRMEKFREVFKKYRRDKCQKTTQRPNLTEIQKKGLDSLMKRIQNEDLLVCMTDKTGKMEVTVRQT